MISDTKLNKLAEKYASLEKEAQNPPKDPQLAQLFEQLRSQLTPAFQLRAAIESIERIADENLSQEHEQAAMIYADAIRRLQYSFNQLDDLKRSLPGAIRTLQSILAIHKKNIT